ncbi:hypothetical protein BH24ACI1_BH24ACI1_24470 [soil metagenome]
MLHLFYILKEKRAAVFVALKISVERLEKNFRFNYF